MKKLRYPVSIFLFFLGIFIAEMYVSRGYFISGYVDDYNKGIYKLTSIQADDPDSLLNYHYAVKWVDDSTLSFDIRNNGFGCQYFTHYRYDEGTGFLNTGVKEEMAGVLPFLYRLSSPLKNSTKEYEFSCGTGLGQTTFCPLHSLNTVIRVEELIASNPNLWDFMNFNSGYFYDIFNNKKICSWVFNEDSKTLLNWNKDYVCNEKDSVELQFHLPLHSVFDKKERKIYSNSIKVPYCDLLEKIKNEMIRK